MAQDATAANTALEGNKSALQEIVRLISEGSGSGASFWAPFQSGASTAIAGIQSEFKTLWSSVEADARAAFAEISSIIIADINRAISKLAAAGRSTFPRGRAPADGR